jgi:hypothetical protein
MYGELCMVGLLGIQSTSTTLHIFQGWIWNLGTHLLCESQKHTPTCYHFGHFVLAFHFFRLKEPSDMLQIDFFLLLDRIHRTS